MSRLPGVTGTEPDRPSKKLLRKRSSSPNLPPGRIRVL